jgi:hypothetical protein
MATFSCDVRWLPADAAAVDALARLQLAAGRAGLELRLRNASPELVSLVAFIGLGQVLCVEPERQSEEWEQRLRVEKERQLGDPAA